MGVDKAAETLAEALTRGMSLDLVTAILAFAESHRGQYGPGAIVSRLTLTSGAQLPADRGWPPARPDPHARRLSEAEHQAAMRAQHDQEARADAERKARKKQLELQFGPEIDARTPEQLAELLPPDDPVRPYVIHRKFGPKNGMVRNRLLEVMAAAYPSA